MKPIIVLENPKSFELAIPAVEVVAARDYIGKAQYGASPRTRVFNLCRTYGYQTIGYYVSLLATARGHRPIPSVTTLQDLRMQSIVRVISDDLDATVQRSLGSLKTDRFTLSIYFGRNLARRYDALSNALFSHFPAPFLRAEFSRSSEWRMDSLRTVSFKDIPEGHRDFVVAQAQRYFQRPRHKKAESYRFDLAILVNPDEVDAPSDARAIAKFVKAAKELGMRATVIGKDEIGRIAEYDGLFIRETTSVNHHTFRFARRAEAEGLVVIDDSESIVRCSSKVYLAEVFQRHGIAHPRSVIVSRDNADQLANTLGFPCVLKRPDSSFSLGVVKVENQSELDTTLAQFFESSELVVAQEFTPSTFDWRVGVLAGRALYACRYYMARGHWKIQVAESATQRRYGRVETVGLDEVPEMALRLAEKSATLIGRGFYGVDIKQINGGFTVIEINDNPSIEAGCEDAVLKDDLYRQVMRVFLERVERRGVSGGGVERT